MANRRAQPGGNGGRRMDFNRNDSRKNFGRSGLSPWQGAGPGGGLPTLLPITGGSTEATLALASNLINLLQPRQNPVPSLLDMPIRRDFGPQMLGRFDRGFVSNRMGNQGNFRRTGNYNRAGERINSYRKNVKPNDGQKQQPKSFPKKEADSKAKPVKESENQELKKVESSEQADDKEDEPKRETPKTRYDDINHQMLKCHVCNKNMWDGRSFENHLSGRAHAIMMQKTAQSYALTADTMRQEFKIREMKRNRRTGQQPTRDFYCAMCDMYAGDGALHRTTVGHRKLKKYLHPTCTTCHKELPTRIELDEHRLTAEHLRTMQDKHEVITKPKPEVMVISTLSQEQSYLRDDRHRRLRYERLDEAREAEATKNGESNQEPSTEPGSEEDKNKKRDKDTEDTILDFKEGDDLSQVTVDKLPDYSAKRGVGESFLSEFRCVQCRLCHKLLDSDETARVHLRTWKHHQLFVKMLMPPPIHESQGSRAHKRPRDGEDEDEGAKRQKNDGDTEDNKIVDYNGDITMKEEPQDTAEDGADEGANDDALPATDDFDQLEDWEESVDEILEDERQNNAEVQEPEPVVEQEPVVKQEPVVEPEPVVKPAPVGEPEPVGKPELVVEPVPEAKPEPVKPAAATPQIDNRQRNSPQNDHRQRNSPRGRGHGRGRGRGRY